MHHCLSPSASAKDAAYVSSLNDEIHKLRERIRALERALFADYVPPVSLDLGRHQIIILQTILKHRVVPAEMLWTALYSGDDSPPMPNAYQCLVSRLRKKLARYGVTISSRPGYGYWMTAESKERLLGIGDEETLTQSERHDLPRFTRNEATNGKVRQVARRPQRILA